MKIFGHTRDGDRADLRHPTLSQRRMLHALRRVLLALLAGLSVFFALGSIVHSTQTRSVVVVHHALKRGRTIRPDDVRMQEIPAHPAFSSAFNAAGEAVKLIAQVDLSPGTILLRPMARASPIPVTGSTVMGVRVIGADTAILPGDTVSLVAANGCQAGKQGDADRQDTDGLCTLARSAMVMGLQHKDADTQTTVMQLALPPPDAARVMAVGEDAGIMAVHP